MYGIGRELDRGQWRAVIRQLTSLGYLESPSESRGGLCFGAETLVRPLLRGEASLELALPPPQKEQRARRAGGRADAGSGAWGARTGSAAAGLEEADVDSELLAALKTWRREQARAQGVPPYVVFHDRTLMELAARRPSQLDDLACIGGIGAAKLERYGEALLAVLTGEPP